MSAWKWMLTFLLIWLFFGLVGVAAVLAGLYLMRRFQR